MLNVALWIQSFILQRNANLTRTGFLFPLAIHTWKFLWKIAESRADSWSSLPKNNSDREKLIVELREENWGASRVENVKQQQQSPIELWSGFRFHVAYKLSDHEQRWKIEMKMAKGWREKRRFLEGADFWNSNKWSNTVLPTFWSKIQESKLSICSKVVVADMYL